MDAAASDGATSSVTYLADGSGRPYGGVYASSESTPVAFGIVTTDRGDVRALTDAAGVAFAFHAHDPYGNPAGTQTRAAGSADATAAAAIAGANVLRYAGYAYDAHPGLYYCSARYYDPATASFITKDPAKADGEESAYQYCGGDPVGRVDPSGEWSVMILGKWSIERQETAYGGNKIYRLRRPAKTGGVDTMYVCSWNPHFWPFANQLSAAIRGFEAIRWSGVKEWYETLLGGLFPAWTEATIAGAAKLGPQPAYKMLGGLQYAGGDPAPSPEGFDTLRRTSEEIRSAESNLGQGRCVGAQSLSLGVWIDTTHLQRKSG